MKKGFTLIEILVVIAIIAAVAGVLYPVFSRSKQAALETKSISNMRQIYLAIQAYRNDCEGTAYGKAEEMGLPPAPFEKWIGPAAKLNPPLRRAGLHYFYYPIPSAEDHRVPSWEDYTETHFGSTVVIADVWFDSQPAKPPYTSWVDDPDAEKYVLGITLDGSLRKKRAIGHLEMAWWDR
ncbi:MAG: prepilin-type N-terminal cleavage/methylation domain-containing protein [Fimbriimonadaceae bacterium]